MLGATSMVGSHFLGRASLRIAAADLADPKQLGLRVERFSRIDLTHLEEVATLVHSAPEPAVVNFAARTDVDPIERERSWTGARPGPAWTVNALAPQSIAAACRASGKYFVQISTDFVFDGTAGPYDESAPRSPFSEKVSWYGWTKSEGERLSGDADPSRAVVRISYPYRAQFSAKLDFARWMVERYRKGALPPLYANQQITPTWVPDVTRVLEELLRRRVPGVFHVASPEVTSPFEFGRELLSRTEGTTPTVEAGSLSAPRPGSGIAPRPLRGGLRSTRSLELGIRLTSWRTGIEHLAAGDERYP